jgi:sugar lactone lactonase YvrE
VPWTRELYFSDIYNGGVYCRAVGGEVHLVVGKRKAVGGTACHADGGLVITGRSVQHVRDGETRVLLEDPTLRCFNDLGVDSSGRVVVGSVRDRFADGTPVGGPGQVAEHRRRPHGELYRIGPRNVEVLYAFDGLSNGIAFSPDGSVLYHVTTTDGLIVHDVLPDGRLTGRRSISLGAEGGDGVAMDVAGCLWVASGPGVRRLDPTGKVMSRLNIPTKRAISLCIGGEDGRTMFVTTADNTAAGDGGSVFRTRVERPGVRITPAQV